jgi:hypothetical protein
VAGDGDTENQAASVTELRVPIVRRAWPSSSGKQHHGGLQQQRPASLLRSVLTG